MGMEIGHTAAIAATQAEVAGPGNSDKEMMSKMLELMMMFLQNMTGGQGEEAPDAGVGKSAPAGGGGKAVHDGGGAKADKAGKADKADGVESENPIEKMMQQFMEMMMQMMMMMMQQQGQGGAVSAPDME